MLRPPETGPETEPIKQIPAPVGFSSGVGIFLIMSYKQIMESKSLKEAIDALWESRLQGRHLPAEWKGKLSVDEGYQIQLGQLEKHVRSGDEHVGWKVGLTAKAIQDQFEYHEPVFGYLLKSGMLASGASLIYDDMIAPGFENELCVTIGEDLKGPGVSLEQARAAIRGVAPALEVVEKRGEFAADAALSLADNVQQRYFVVGEETSPLAAEVKLSQVQAQVYINGEEVDSADGSEVLGDPAASVAWLANRLAGFGWKLDAGARVMTGSFTKQYPLNQGDYIETVFSLFGEVKLEVG